MIDPAIFLKKVSTMTKQNPYGDWSDFLFEHGMDYAFGPIYDNLCIRKSNIIFSFAVLAFSPFSNMVHLHKDRVENKKEILAQLGWYELPPSDFNILIYNKDVSNADDDDPFLKHYLSAVSWFIAWHRDSKYKNWVNTKEFVSINSTYATEPPSEFQQIAVKGGGTENVKTPDNVIAFTALKKADLMGKCIALDERAARLEDSLKSKYSDLDSILAFEIGSLGTDFEYDPTKIEHRLYKDKFKQKNNE